MRPMPEQNSLPFPDAPKPPTPAQKPATTDAPAPDAAAPPATDHDNAAPTAGVPMAPPSPTRQAKRPRWARLLGRVADPWLARNLEPEAPGGLLLVEGGVRLHFALQSGKVLKIGALQLASLRVEISVLEGDAAAAKQLLSRVDRATQRGGG